MSPKTLVAALTELRAAYAHYKNDPSFQKEFRQTLAEYVGRPSPITFVRRLSEKYGGARIYLKREDLNHTGAHKINNAIGQVLLAQRTGKKRIIAETGADSTVSPLPPSVQKPDCLALSTWEKMTSNDKTPMCNA